MKIQPISFYGRIKKGDIINKLEKLDARANKAVEKLEQRFSETTRKFEAKVLENPEHPTPLDDAKIITTGVTGFAPTAGGLTTTTYQPSWDASTII